MENKINRKLKTFNGVAIESYWDIENSIVILKGNRDKLREIIKFLSGDKTPSSFFNSNTSQQQKNLNLELPRALNGGLK